MAAAFPIRTLALAGVLVLAACTETPDDPVSAAAQAPDAPVSNAAGPSTSASPGRPALVSPVGPATPSDCNAPKAELFVGRRADRATRADLAAAVAPTAAIRWVGPGDATTEDYSPQRLNVMLDVGGKIVSVHCG
jgi:hypothetical protein